MHVNLDLLDNLKGKFDGGGRVQKKGKEKEKWEKKREGEKEEVRGGE